MQSQQKRNYDWIEFLKKFNLPMNLTDLQREWYKNYKKYYHLK